MAEAKWFLSLAGAFVLGLVALAASFAAAILLSPFVVPWLISVLPFLAGILIGISAILFVAVIFFAVVYSLTMLGILLVYLFRPMKVEKRDKGYSMDKTNEAGKRKKGESKS